MKTLSYFTGQLCLISDLPRNFQKYQNRLSNYKRSENINYAIVKFGKMFYEDSVRCPYVRYGRFSHFVNYNNTTVCCLISNE